MVALGGSLADNCAPPILSKLSRAVVPQRQANALNIPDRQACTPHGVSVHKPNRGRLPTVSPRANCDPTTATAIEKGLWPQAAGGLRRPSAKFRGTGTGIL
jgi:hypothetical protein